MPEGEDWQVKARMSWHRKHEVRALARRRRSRSAGWSRAC
jgi:hypothetical protein